MANTSLGTPFYLSPEVCNGNPYDYKSDAWMLGCVLYEMCTLKRPFEGESLSQVVYKIIELPYLPLDDNRFDPIFNEILSMLLNKSAILRASVPEILALENLQPRVEKFTKINEEYLTAVEERMENERLHKQGFSPEAQSTNTNNEERKAIGVNAFQTGATDSETTFS